MKIQSASFVGKRADTLTVAKPLAAFSPAKQKIRPPHHTFFSSWVHLILSSNLSRKFRTLLQDLFSWPPVTTTQHLSWKKLHWLPILERIKYKVSCLCFSATSGSGPAYLSELLHVYTSSRTLRSSSDTARMLKIQQ